MRFSLAFRGYRMSEVDALLDRLAAASARALPTRDRGRRTADRVVATRTAD